MPNRTSFNDLVDNIHSIMGTVSDSARQSLSENSFVDSIQPSPTTDLYEAARQVSEEYASGKRFAPGQSMSAGEAAKNLGASLVSGTTRLGGWVVSLPFAGVASDLQNIPQEYLDAYELVRNAEAKGLSGPEIEAAKAKLKESETPALQEGEDPRTRYGKTLKSTESYGSRIESALNAANISGDINKFTDTSSLVDNRNRQRLSEDTSNVFDEGAPKIEEGYKSIQSGDVWKGISDIADGATDLLFGGAGALAENPLAVAEYVVENIPQLASGLAGTAGKLALTTSTLGYGGDVYTQAILDFQSQNDGKLPTGKEIKQMVGSGALAGIADLVGDMSVIQSLGKAVKEVKKGIGTTAKNIAGATVVEGATEAFQTYQEQRAQLKDPNWKEIYEAGLIGAAVGGSVRGGLETLTAGATKVKQTKDDLVKSAQEAKVKEATVSAAVDTGDTSTITDPIILAETLVRRNQREDVTEEEKVSNVDKLNTLVQEEQQNQANIISELEQIVSKGAEGLTRDDATKLQTLESQLNDSDSRLASLRNFQDGITVKPITSTVEDKAKAQEGDVESANRVFGSYRIDPNSLSEEEARALAKSPAYTPEQQAELNNHADLQALVKDAGQVSNDILNGNLDSLRKGQRPFIGIRNYKDIITGAVAKGDTTTANKYLEMLGNFSEHMQTKAGYLQQAVDSVKSGKPVPQELRTTLADYGITKLTPAIIKFNDNVIQPEAQMVTKAFDLLTARVAIPVTETVKQEPIKQDEIAENKPDTNVGTVDNKQVNQETGNDNDVVQRTTDTVSTVQSGEQQQPAKNKEINQKTKGSLNNAIKSAQAIPEKTGLRSSINKLLTALGKGLNTELIQTEKEVTGTDGTVLKEDAEVLNKFKEAISTINRLKISAKKYGSFAVSAEALGIDLNEFINKWYYDVLPEVQHKRVEEIITEFEESQIDFGQMSLLESNKESVKTSVRVQPTEQQIENVNSTVTLSNKQIADEIDRTYQDLESSNDLRVYKSIAERYIKEINNQESNSFISAYNSLIGVINNRGVSRKLKGGVYTHIPVNKLYEVNAINQLVNKLLDIQEQEQVESVKVNEVEPSVTDLILTQPVNEDLPIEQQNLVAKGFTKGSNISALETYSNFIEAIKNNPSILDQYVSFEESGNARAALGNFILFYNKVSKTLDTMFKEKKEGFKYQDYVQFLAIDGKLPDNVKAAIAIGAYDWITNTANKTVFNSDDDIRSMLGMPEDSIIPMDIRIKMQSGIPQSLIVESMGKAAIASLNLRAKKTAMLNQQSNLENALGSYAFALVRELDWVAKPVIINKAELDSIIGSDSHTIKDNIRLLPLKMEDSKLIPEIKYVIEGSKIYPSLFSKLFSIQSERPEPSFKPLKVSSKVKKSFMKVPQRTREILNKVNSWKWRYNKSYDLFAALDRNSQRAIMGYDFDVDNKLKVQQLGIQAKNDSIDREIDALNTFADIGYGKDFYLSWEVWKNQRMGIKNIINPQTSKLHRHFVGLKNWTTTVDPTNQAQYNKYLVTVAGGFGITPEKKSEEWVIEKFKAEVLTNEIYLSGIEAMRKLRENPDSDFEEQQQWYADIVAAVELGGENAYTFQALETLASEKAAEGSKFTHSMTREVDGITNGVNITTIQFPDANEDMFVLKLARQGMYFDDTEGFADWKSKGDPDSYEGIASKWKDALEASGVTNSPLYLALSKYVGEIGRNTAKSPLMTTIYGAGIKGVISNAAHIAVDEMYTKLESLLKANDVVGLKELAKDLKTITGSEPAFNYVASDLFTANKDFELRPQQLAKFVASFESVYQDGLSKALEAEYSDLFTNRDKFNAAINIAGELFKRMYMQRVEALRSTLNTKVEDITSEQHEAILRDMAEISPIIPTLMSGKDFGSGVALMKTEQVRTDDSAYKVDISFNLSTAKTGSQEGRKLSFLNPGVGSIPIAVQSLDASNILRAMNFSNPFLNVHDAQAVGDADAYSNPQILNYSHFKNMGQYSIPEEFSKMFDRVVGAASPEIISEVMADNNTKRYLKQFEGMDLNGISKQLRNAAIELTNTKNERLAKLNTVGQYYNGEQTVYKTNDLAKQSMETAVKEDVKAIRDKATNAPKTRGEEASSHGSSKDQSIKYKYTFETQLEINKFNVQQIFDYLGNLGTKVDTATHAAHLKSILDNMVSKVLTPIDLHIAKSVGEETKGMITGTDMYIANQDITLSSSGLLTRMSMSSQEVFAHELIHAITRSGLDKNITARRELKRIYEIARKSITPQMLAQSNNPDELAAAQETWDYLFNPQMVQGRSNYLHEFVAFAMTNEPVRILLSNMQTKPTKSDWFKGSTLLEKVNSFFSNLLDWLNGKYFTGTYNLSADKQLDILVRQIAGIQANNKGLLVNAVDKALLPLSMAGNRMNQFGKTAIAKIVESSFVTKNKSAIIRVGGQLGKMYVDSGYAALINNTLNRKTLLVINSENAYLNELRAIVTEAKGRTKKNAALHDVKRIGTSTIDRMRQRLRNVVAKHLLKTFDPSTELGRAQKAALSYAIIKTDMHDLVDIFGLTVAMNLLKDPAALAKEINNYRAGLDNFTLVQAENLGHMMITGYSRIDNALLNAYNISRRAGTGEPIPTNAQQIEAQVNVLASLYAIQYLDTKKKDLANGVIANELSKGNSNGITAMIYTLKMIREESMEKLFKETPELYTKGYMADHIDPNVSVKVGLASDEADLVKQGYVKGPKLQKDITDPMQKERFLYVNRYGGMQAYLAGAVYLQSDKARGTNIYSLEVGLGDIPVNLNGDSTLERIKKSKEVLSKAQYAKGILPNSHESKMIPIVNGKGEIVDYRYVMSDNTKDTLMNRDTSFEVVMGIMTGTVNTKPEITKQNRKVVEALYEQYNEDYKINPVPYVVISKDSTNPRYAEIWKMIPYDMKQDIKAVWGGDKIVIRREHVDLIFGYRKYSVTNRWRKDPLTRNAWDKLVIATTTAFFGPKVVSRLRMGEDFIQELVRLGKDVIVIKSFVVTLANTISNIFLLSVKGINPVTAMKDYTIAFKAAQDYKRMANKVEDYRLKLKNPNITQAQYNQYQSEIAKLSEDILASPVRDLISQGVLQNIVEDIDIGIDTFTFKKTLTDKVSDKLGLDKVSSNVPSWMKSLAMNALVLQGSGLYNALRDMAQLSDFGARYALYNHLRRKGETKEDAIGVAMDTFIDYDLPSGVGMQYANDMGMVMFSKYLIRVQKIIFQTFKENPAAVLSIIALQNYFNFGENIHNSLIGVTNPFNRLGTPLDYVEALENTVTMNLASNLM